MKKSSAAGTSSRPSRRKLTYVKSVAEIPDFKSDDEIDNWYQSHSTVLVQDQMETLPAKVGGPLLTRLAARRNRAKRSQPRPTHSSR
jgi:hypothetical protein